MISDHLSTEEPRAVKLINTAMPLIQNHIKEKLESKSLPKIPASTLLDLQHRSDVSNFDKSTGFNHSDIHIHIRDDVMWMDHSI
jgi:hypothetical protein